MQLIAIKYFIHLTELIIISYKIKKMKMISKQKTVTVLKKNQ